MVQKSCLLQSCLQKFFDELGISLPVSPSRTNLKLRNISVTPKMVKNVITTSKASGPD